jgi:uncharacterized protein (TIGR00299 family) protein
MGAAGDMMMAALLELHDNPADFLSRLNNAGIPGVRITTEQTVKCGIKGTHVNVLINGQTEETEHEHEHAHGGHHHAHEHHTHEHEHAHGDEHDTHHSHEHNHDAHPHKHSHNSYAHIEQLISRLSIPEAVKQNAAAVYKIIAEAESHAHSVPVTQIHFHEVGETDAVADIVGVCMLMHELAPDVIAASPVNVGSGQVRCAHGILPVPAPATARILRNIPMYADNSSNGELCTPTGAALLKHFVNDFAKMPVINVEKIGYGMGKKDFEKANCVRAFIGETGGASEEVSELVCNLDDMTPETVAFAQQILFEAGALDVYTTVIGMKKGRVGISLTCMCRAADREKMLPLIFKHTSTLGVREYVSKRYTLRKEQSVLQTPHGAVSVKTSSGYGVVKSKPEYEDIAAIAREKGVSLREVMESIDESRHAKH